MKSLLTADVSATEIDLYQSWNVNKNATDCWSSNPLVRISAQQCLVFSIFSMEIIITNCDKNLLEQIWSDHGV